MSRAPRDYRAEYQARKERAAARGLTGQAAYGHKKRAAEVEAHRVERAARQAAAGAKRALTPRQLKAIEKRRKTKVLGPVRIVKTSSARRIVDELRAADKRSDRVAIYTVVQVGPGDFRTRVLDGQKRLSPKRRQRGAATKPPRDVQLVIAPPLHQAWTPESPGLLPGEVLETIGGYRDDGASFDDAVWSAIDEYVGEAYE